MRRGFSMITAIIFLVVLSTLGMLALSLATTSAKQTSDLYLREQAELLLQSGTEYALLAFSAHDFTANCIEKINATYDVFDINISLRYFYRGANACPTPSGENRSNIDTNDSNLTMMIDTVVSTRTDVSTEPIRIHRRTIQKP